ncbi:MAG: hypothetical protein AMJ53_09830 [Gammaproteobacteria bacterium SG8_11]|nr:MAG: hypothetical protein AMJ53_09830 [Gammaproteobacteria bacterium SG8_11]
MRTGILITARLKSVRLPRKAIKPINGRPMLEYLVERLRAVKCADEMILCTSPFPEDDPLVEIAEKENIKFFRGDPDDVLKRLKDAAEKYEIDRILNVTADNPLIDPTYLDRLAKFLTDNKHDFAATEGLPWGTFGWAVTYPAIVRACEIKAEQDTEVWGGYFTETGLFSCGTLKADEEHFWPDLRLTVDTPEDFRLVSTIIERLSKPMGKLQLSEIIEFCRKNPDLVTLNSEIQQKKPKPIRLKSTND